MHARRIARFRGVPILRVLIFGLPIFGVLVLAGCRPEIEFDLDGRQSEIDAVTVTATLAPDGVVHVEQRYRFASGEGGTLALPKDLVDESLTPQAIDAVGGIRNVTLDGRPVTPTQGTVEPELRVRAERATVAYDELGAAGRYSDIGVVRLDVLASPEDASRQDPDVDLSGTLVLPEGTPGPVDAHLHGGRDRSVAAEGSAVTFSAQAPIWQPSHSLDVALPEAWLSAMAPTPIASAGPFATEQAARDQADTSTEATLGGLDNQAELGRWILTAVAFGLPAIFWAIVVVGLVRRLRERKRVVGNVPDHLSDPPTAVDPAIVAVLDGEGRPAKTAVAGTVLDLARREAIDLREYGDRVVIKVPLEAMGVNESEQLVLNELRALATPEGVLEGAHIWRQPIRWWRTYRRDLVKRARGMGLVERWMPLASLSGALITTGVGMSVFFFTQPVVYFAMVFGAMIVGYIISFVSGYTLTDKGWRQRALWRSFARYIHDHGEIDKAVGPAGVVVWGPYLTYGAVLDEASAAARPLTP
ncbi:MAG: DUF2207 domain-containing protein [Acidimicrobiia bacterium]|nr:DUF2207 domain-containing protein [Acidimicrobiia bacterium]